MKASRMSEYTGPERRKKTGTVVNRSTYSWTQINVMRHTDAHRIPNAEIAAPPVPEEPERVWASKPVNKTKFKSRKQKISAEKIRKIRLSLWLTQKELAEKIGVSKTSVFYWESGRNGIGLMAEHLLLELAKKLPTDK